ncbi:hypothetical protein FRC00_008355 [Tulasnella sp. 408]|nr:hypothetical protein FRC00_008355 [Tulasnella sp. 408]
MEVNDSDSDLVLPTRGEDDGFKFQRDYRQRKHSKGTTRWTLVGGILGTLSVFSSLIFVTLSLDSNTTLLPISLDSPIRQYFNDPEQDPGQMALDGTWKEGFSPQTFNEFFENRMATCKSGKVRCRTNWNKLILLPWGHFAGYFKGSRQGENIWTDAMMDAMWALGYSMLLPKDTPETYELFRRHYQNVHMILWSDAQGQGAPCLWNSSCVYAGDPLSIYPVPPPNSTHLNIPLWKIFSMHFWNGPLGPLGRPFTVSPEPYHLWNTYSEDEGQNYYIGYSVERTCMKTPYIQHAERPRQAYILAKSLSYFQRPDYLLSDPSGNNATHLTDDFYAKIAEEIDMTWVGSFKLDAKPAGSLPPPGIVQLEKLDRPAFHRKLAESRLVLGIGRPALSPTPYEALCLGVPFINTIQGWDQNDPENRSKWYGQHDALLHMDLDEPYVYHVKMRDREGLKRAVKLALETPIPRCVDAYFNTYVSNENKDPAPEINPTFLFRYIPPRMKMSAVVQRVRDFLGTDWRPTAKIQMSITNYTFRHD